MHDQLEAMSYQEPNHEANDDQLIKIQNKRKQPWFEEMIVQQTGQIYIRTAC